VQPRPANVEGLSEGERPRPFYLGFFAQLDQRSPFVDLGPIRGEGHVKRAFRHWAQL
jgi:hypothetical protein